MKPTILALSTLLTATSISASASPFSDSSKALHHPNRHHHAVRSLSLNYRRAEAAGEDEAITNSDAARAEAFAQSLEEDDEDYDTRPDGITDEEYYQDLKEKDEEDGGVVPLDTRAVETGEDEVITTSDAARAEAFAQSLEEDDEDYDTRPDGISDEEYYQDLREKDEEDGGIVPADD